MVEGYNDEGGSPVHGRFRRGRIGRTSRKNLEEGPQGRTTRWERIHARRKDIGLKKVPRATGDEGEFLEDRDSRIPFIIIRSII